MAKLTIQQIRKDLVYTGTKYYRPEDDTYYMCVFYTQEEFFALNVTTLPKSWYWDVDIEGDIIVGCPLDLINLYKAVKLAEEWGL